MQFVNTIELKKQIQREFSGIVEKISLPFINEIKVDLIDGSFIKLWFSLKLANRYSYHWDRRNVTGKIYRHDNSPHLKWKKNKNISQTFS